MSYSFKDNEEAYDFLTPVREEDEEYKEEKQDSVFMQIRI